MKKYNTRGRHEVSGVRFGKQNGNFRTGKAIDDKWNKRSGVRTPVAGDSLAALDARLAAL